VVVAFFAGCGGTPVKDNESDGHRQPHVITPSLIKRIDRSLSRAAQFLLARQAADGAWRSDTYGSFKDGPSLTPLALNALLTCPASAEVQAACRKGSAYLAAMARPDGSIDEGKRGLNYPVYTAAGAVIVLSKTGFTAQRKARDAWLAYLRQRQLTEDLGWQPADKEYGGWGYAIDLPRKPKQEALTESNLSATVFALDALRAAGRSSKNPALAKALKFVKRCQNYEDNSARRNAAFDDGGFFFIYDDADRNKAGLAGKEDGGRERFFSYGSATADGLRCLLVCGLGRGHPRVRAVRHWLEANFSAVEHPGQFAAASEGKRPAVYYYYAWSVARALQAAAGPEIPTRKGKLRWAELLADELLKRQRDNGSWSNPAVFVREDDPIVATGMASMALSICCQVITRADGEGAGRRSKARRMGRR
jgi:squalene-hopene/tetraprenyl-beta-curcumene cyclase